MGEGDVEWEWVEVGEGAEGEEDEGAREGEKEDTWG